LQTMINALLSADADAVVGAEWGKPSSDRITQRTLVSFIHTGRGHPTSTGGSG